MPLPRKVDLLPAELRDWLREELVARGFGDYEALSEALNTKLALTGSELSLSKSAIHRFGSEYHEFVKLQEEAGNWVEGFMAEVGMADEAKRHSALFQMLTALAFKTMKAAMESEAPDPKDLHFLGKMLKDVMSSSPRPQGLERAVPMSKPIRTSCSLRSGAQWGSLHERSGYLPSLSKALAR